MPASLQKLSVGGAEMATYLSVRRGKVPFRPW